MAVAAGRVKVGRERQTTIMTVTDGVEMGMGNAAKRALEVVWDGADAVWLSFDVDCVDARLRVWKRLAREMLKFLDHRGQQAFS